MKRREFLGAMAVAPLAIGTQPASPVRRTFEITTRIELPEAHDAAVAGTRVDSLDPERFKYTITAREV